MTEQAVNKTEKETKEKDDFVRECAARNEYLEGQKHRITLNESMQKLHDRELMKTVWFN